MRSQDFGHRFDVHRAGDGGPLWCPDERSTCVADVIISDICHGMKLVAPFVMASRCCPITASS